MLEGLSSACSRSWNNLQNKEERQKSSNRNGSVRGCAESAVAVRHSVRVHVRGLDRSSQKEQHDAEHRKHNGTTRARARSGAQEGHSRNYTLTSILANQSRIGRSVDIVRKLPCASGQSVGLEQFDEWGGHLVSLGCSLFFITKRGPRIVSGTPV